MTSRTSRHPALRGARFVFFGILINAALACIKGIAGVLGNSNALIADAMESTLDVFQSLIVLGGLFISASPPDYDHPYGHGKAEPLAAMVVAMGLFAGAILVAIQSIGDILVPHSSPEPFTLVVLVVVVLTKEVLARAMHRVGRDVQSVAVHSDAVHHRGDAITSAAAFVGISVALAGGKGWESADDWAALLACAVIAYNGFRLLRPALNEVMDIAPDPAIEEQVRSTAMTIDGVLELDRCSVRKMGSEYFVDLHVIVNGDISVRQGHEVAHRVKDAIRKADPHIRDVLIHVEPHDTVHGR